MHNDLLEKSAVEAVLSAALKLNVDPMRFARFLQEGRIADILSALGRQEVIAAHRAEVASLNNEYLDFLEREMELCREEIRAMVAGPGD